MLLLVVIEHFEIAHQLLPIVRLDGYYIIADLTGVPDLFARIGPILASMGPWHGPDERVAVLKRWVRWAVTAWVVLVIPILGGELLVLLIHLPRIIGTAWSSGTTLERGAHHAMDAGHVASAAAGYVQVVVLAIPIVGIVLMVWRFLRQTTVWTWTHTDGRPAMRGLATAAAVGCSWLLMTAWVPRHNYRPIGPHARGTVSEGLSGAVAAGRHIGALDRPLHRRLARPTNGGQGSAGAGQSAPAPARPGVTTSTSTTAASTTSTSTPTTSTTVAAPAGGTRGQPATGTPSSSTTTPTTAPTNTTVATPTSSGSTPTTAAPGTTAPA
jgi:putative peptide zinc metalloprotease protein